MKNKNVWLRKHFQKKFNERLKWYEEMERTGEMPEAMIQDREDAIRRNAGHEPETDMIVFKRKYRHTFPALSFLKHPCGV